MELTRCDRCGDTGQPNRDWGSVEVKSLGGVARRTYDACPKCITLVKSFMQPAKAETT